MTSSSSSSLQAGPPKKRPPVKFTETVKKFILDKLSEGYTIAEMKRKWPDKLPDAKNIYKKSLSDPEWAERLDQGYTLWYYAKMEELDKLSNGLACELYPEAEFREAEAALKRRIDTLKFSLGKMAPVMAKRFDKTVKVEHSGDSVGPQILIMDYSVSEEEVKAKATKIVSDSLHKKTLDNLDHTENN